MRLVGKCHPKSRSRGRIQTPAEVGLKRRWNEDQETVPMPSDTELSAALQRIQNLEQDILGLKGKVDAQHQKIELLISRMGKLEETLPAPE